MKSNFMGIFDQTYPHFFGKSLIFLAFIWISTAQYEDHSNFHMLNESNLDSLQRSEQWVDSMLSTMSVDEKIGQLFMVRAHSNLGAKHIQELERQISKYHIGGLCFFQGTAAKQLELTNHYQSISKIPLLVSMDAEWGLSMRLQDSVIVYPRNLMLGAISNNQLMYEYGKVHASQLKRIGVHINFGPVIDVNNNPRNPVINDRSFGEDKYNVVTKAYMYMIGLQDEGVIACGKHFPGHGDTNVDSHHDLPVINHSKARLEELELFPFELLCDNGLQSVMIAHVHVPVLDSTPNMPTSLSKAVVDTLLRQKMAYDGLVFTDALEMKGVTRFFKPGEIELKAFLAGNDVLLLPENIEIAFKSLQDSYANGVISNDRLDESVRRILRAKYSVGLSKKFEKLEPKNLNRDLNLEEYLVVKEQLISEALTLVRDDLNHLPISDDKHSQVYFIHLGCDNTEMFENTSRWYGNAIHLKISEKTKSHVLDSIMKQVDATGLIVLTFHPKKRVASANYGIEDKYRAFFEDMCSAYYDRLIIANFGNPYGLKYLDKAGTIIAAYEDDPMAYGLFVQNLYGARSFAGRLPVGVSDRILLFAGLRTELNHSLRFSLPETVGLRSRSLLKIDTIVTEMIRVKAAPGCQILAIKDQSVVYYKGFGTHTYEKQSKEVSLTDLYDIASITKVAASTIAIMKLYEDGLLDLDKPMSEYLPFLNNGQFTIREVLLHRAGLTPWIPFYKQTVSRIKGNVFSVDTSIYVFEPTEGYLEVAENMWIKKEYIDTMLKYIVEHPYMPDKSYRYSDLGFILIPFLVERLSGMPFDEYLNMHFYEPLGLKTMMFNPRKKDVSPKRIVPTEIDQYFRNQLLSGHVHDMAAAMFGGVSGHAGLFSNAYDLAVLFSMLVNGGYYNGKRYLHKETIDYFTTRPSGETRRGLGFDMIQLQKGKAVNVTGLASSRTFGHTGFTGTAVWADPECGIIYVFLSNRVHPSMENSKINDYQYRLRIHNAIYRSMDK